MDPIVQIALISAISVVIASSLAGGASVSVSLILNRQRRQERAEDYAERHEVAAKAAEAARLLVISNKDVAQTARLTIGKLDVIHTLVNSKMTESMQAQLEATIGQLTLAEEVVELRRSRGVTPSLEALGVIAAAKAKIAELKATLADRMKQAEAVEIQQENAESKGVDIR